MQRQLHVLRDSALRSRLVRVLLRRFLGTTTRLLHSSLIDVLVTLAVLVNLLLILRLLLLHTGTHHRTLLLHLQSSRRRRRLLLLLLIRYLLLRMNAIQRSLVLVLDLLGSGRDTLLILLRMLRRVSSLLLEPRHVRMRLRLRLLRNLMHRRLL